jgi:hypothetical protein
MAVRSTPAPRRVFRRDPETRSGKRKNGGVVAAICLRKPRADAREFGGPLPSYRSAAEFCGHPDSVTRFREAFFLAGTCLANKAQSQRLERRSSSEKKKPAEGQSTGFRSDRLRAYVAR